MTKQNKQSTVKSKKKISLITKSKKTQIASSQNINKEITTKNKLSQIKKLFKSIKEIDKFESTSELLEYLAKEEQKFFIKHPEVYDMLMNEEKKSESQQFNDFPQNNQFMDMFQPAIQKKIIASSPEDASKQIEKMIQDNNEKAHLIVQNLEPINDTIFHGVDSNKEPFKILRHNTQENLNKKTKEFVNTLSEVYNYGIAWQPLATVDRQIYGVVSSQIPFRRDFNSAKIWADTFDLIHKYKETEILQIIDTPPNISFVTIKCYDPSILQSIDMIIVDALDKEHKEYIDRLRNDKIEPYQKFMV